MIIGRLEAVVRQLRVIQSDQAGSEASQITRAWENGMMSAAISILVALIDNMRESE